MKANFHLTRPHISWIREEDTKDEESDEWVDLDSKVKDGV